MTARLKRKICSVTLFLLLLFVLQPGIGSAQSYMITEEELTTLWDESNKLSSINRKLIDDLNQSKQDLMTAQIELTKYRQELQTLRTDLKKLSSESTAALQESAKVNEALKQSNESLQAYAKEVKLEINRLKTTNTILAGVALYALLKK